jgi:hypothetical protein
MVIIHRLPNANYSATVPAGNFLPKFADWMKEVHAKETPMRKKEGGPLMTTIMTAVCPNFSSKDGILESHHLPYYKKAEKSSK